MPQAIGDFGGREATIHGPLQNEKGETMKTSWTILAAAFGFTLAAAAAQAQSPTLVNYDYGFHQPHHSSTLAEGVRRGTADIIRAEGRYNLETSIANINNEEAYSRYLDNDLKRTDTYFAKRQRNASYRAQMRQPRAMPETYIRLSQQAAPGRLCPEHFDRVFGTVNWPDVFTWECFTPYRKALDVTFAGRGPSDGLGSAAARDIERYSAEMECHLKSLVRELSPSEYVAARRFLNSLAYEARFAPGIEGLAAN